MSLSTARVKKELTDVVIAVGIFFLIQGVLYATLGVFPPYRVVVLQTDGDFKKILDFMVCLWNTLLKVIAEMISFEEVYYRGTVHHLTSSIQLSKHNIYMITR
jgi:hypothetical protein